MDELQRERLLKRPLSIRDTGLTMGMLSELTLKIIYTAGEMGAKEVCDELRLPFAGVVQRVMELLDREELVNIVGAEGFGERSYRYTISRKGVERVYQVMERNRYVGPAPVPLERYSAMLRAQAAREVVLEEAEVRAAFQGLVIDPTILDRLGPALMSGQSLFLYGPAGNGKTVMASRMARLMATDPIYIPYAVSVDTHVIKVYDEFDHRPAGRAGSAPSTLNPTTLVDERWVHIERPTIVVGGELTLSSLDLIWDPAVKYYEAPLQMKANGGMFLVDDFGRQRMDPQELLNRWIVPLETRVDYLSLHTGKKIEIPFEQLVVFATNLDPARLVDEAFLRRIRYKLKVDNPSIEDFCRVFKAVCQARGVQYQQEGFDHLVQEWYVKRPREFKNCHPRDIVDQLLEISRYKRLEPAASPKLIAMAASSYFADL